MTTNAVELAQMVERLRDLMATETASEDFRFPTRLNDVPSFTSDKVEMQNEHTSQPRQYAQLG
ncbi:MAG: hypothetical protein ACK5JR_19630 [Tropicimonas sp.]|uniref:hypothetical protein n=1 Tax=Tropicimonas sp. TaxID=2067044 RepID=UPI003A83DB36